MSNPSGVLTASVARHARIDPIKLRERVFFSGMAIALAATVFAGFAPTYYLHAFVESDDVLTPSLMLHGAVFSAWMVLLVVQTSLIAGRPVQLHRKLGAAGAAVAVAMVVLGAYVAISRTRDGLFVNPAGIPPLAFGNVCERRNRLQRRLAPLQRRQCRQRRQRKQRKQRKQRPALALAAALHPRTRSATGQSHASAPAVARLRPSESQPKRRIRYP